MTNQAPEEIPQFLDVNQPSDSVTERHGYLQRDGKKLFFAEYAPKETITTGVVLVSPFAEEKVRSMRVYVSLARALAARGAAVLCFDYYGDGDSEGEFEQATFEDRLDDIEAAVLFLKSISKYTKRRCRGPCSYVQRRI